MSAIYQGEVIELTPTDLQVLNEELNQEDELQTLTILKEENWLDELESRWDSDYQPRPLSPEEEQEWLEYENGRMESDLIEQENEWL